MKHSLLLCGMLMTALAASAQTTTLSVKSSPDTNGLLKFSSVDYYYFNMEQTDFTKTYNVYNEANELAGTVMADAASFTGYSDSYSTGAFAWTISEPGTYTLEIPEGSFVFKDWNGGTIVNAAINATVTVFKVSEFTIQANLTASDVHYAEDLDGIVLTFDGAESVELGSYAALSYYNVTATGESYYAAAWTIYSGSCSYEVNGNQVTLNGVDSYMGDEQFETLKCVIPGNSYADFGLHYWIVDGVDITADIVFYLSDDVTDAGLPIYKADMTQVFDLAGRRPSLGTGLQIKNGKVIMVK